MLEQLFLRLRMGLPYFVQRDSDGVPEVTVIAPPFRYHAIIQRAKRRRGPADGVHTIGDCVDVVVREHAARNLSVTQRHSIRIAGEPKRQLGHIEVAVHHPQLTENRSTTLT